MKMVISQIYTQVYMDVIIRANLHLNVHESLVCRYSDIRTEASKHCLSFQMVNDDLKEECW